MKLSAAQITDIARSHYITETPRRMQIILDAEAGDKAAVRYLRCLLEGDGYIPTKPVPQLDETRALIIQLDEMGILDQN
jgi:hypothetical protein